MGRHCTTGGLAGRGHLHAKKQIPHPQAGRGPGQGTRGALASVRSLCAVHKLCNCMWQPCVAASLLTGGGRKGPFWMGAPLLSLTKSPLPSIAQSVTGAPSLCQPVLADGEFSQARTWRNAPTEAGLNARRAWRREPVRMPARL